MNIKMIEDKLNEIIKELESEVMSILMDESLDKGQTNLHMKPLASTKQILNNALDSIKMVDKLSKEDIQK
jgi:myo-inositol-1-phosphate synthase